MISMKAVEVNNLTFTYSGEINEALKNVSFDVDKGSIALVIGESGCGKTTLLRHLKPSHMPVGSRTGSICINGKSIEKLSEHELSFTVGFVGQKVDEAFVTDKVWHEIAFGLESMGCDQGYMQQRVAEMTAFFGLEPVYHARLSELSGGQKQLVNLCAVMIMEPDILVLDEPTSQLDPNSAMEFFHMIRKIRDELGTTVIISEHRLEDILPMADKVLVLDKGSVMAEGSPKDVCTHLYEKRLPLFRSMPAAARIFCELHGVDCDELPLSVNEGRRFIETYKKRVKSEYAEGCDQRTDKKNSVVRLDEVWFKYNKDGEDVLKACSIDVMKGKITAVLGGNGAGKSTLLHIIMGNLKPYMGKVKSFDDCSVSLLPQNPQALFAEKTVHDELAGSISGKKGSCINEESRAGHKTGNEEAPGWDDVIEYFGLSGLLNKHPFDLSGGEMEKLALAKMVLMDCDIYLLDEPGKGMDYAFKEKLGAYLRKLTEKGKTILIVSHDVEFCAKYADYCGMFFDGHIVAVENTRTFFLQNSFYTTAVRRMCRGMFDAVTVEDVLAILGDNMSDDMLKEDTVEEDEVGLPGENMSGEGDEALIKGDAETGGDGLPKEKASGECEGDSSKEEASHECEEDSSKEKAVRECEEDRIKKKLVAVIPFIVFLVVMPVTIYIGYAVLHQRKYYFISVLLILEAVATMFVGFEGTRPKLKEIMTIAVMSAITALSRAMFYMTPAVKPTAALTIISGIGLGGIPGFVVGALSMLVSDIFFSQGPWTPWQMFTMGLLGFLAGVIFNRRNRNRIRTGELPKAAFEKERAVKKEKQLLGVCIYGVLSVLLIYGGIMNPASVLMYQENVTWKMLIASYVPGFPIDCIHAASTFIFLWLLTEPMLEKLERVRRK